MQIAFGRVRRKTSPVEAECCERARLGTSLAETECFRFYCLLKCLFISIIHYSFLFFRVLLSFYHGALYLS